MAICILKSNKQLGVNFILTPERYNPRRRMSIDNEDTILMSENKHRGNLLFRLILQMQWEDI